MPHKCVRELGQQEFAEQATSHYIDQCWLIVNCTFRKNFSENLIKMQIHKKAFENVIWEIVAILSRRDELMDLCYPPTSKDIYQT